MNNNIEDFTEEELKKELITTDYHGKDFKAKCLKELPSRAYQRGWKDGNLENCFYSGG